MTVKADPSIGDLVKDATSQVSTLVRAEVELAKAEITRDVKKGLTGSVFFILAFLVQPCVDTSRDRPSPATIFRRTRGPQLSEYLTAQP